MNKLSKLCKDYFKTSVFEIRKRETNSIILEQNNVYFPIDRYALIVHLQNKLDMQHLAFLRNNREKIRDEIRELLSRQQKDFLNSVLNVAVFLNSIRDFEELLNKILIELETLMNASASSVFIRDDKDEYLKFFTLHGGRDGLKMLKIPLEGSVAGDVFKEGKVKIDNDVQSSGKYFKNADRISKFVTHSILAAPLLVGNKCIGVIEVLNKRKEQGSMFDDFDKDMIKVFAAQAAVALENAILNKGMNDYFIGLIKTLSGAIEAKDQYTRGHTDRVSNLSSLIGAKLRLSRDSMETLRLSAILHDIGKIGVSEYILNKPGRLTEDEYLQIKEHVVIGAKILEPIRQFDKIRNAILHHHESFDGYGYPSGLKGDDISIESRIISVADTYDTLTTERPYKKALSKEAAIKEIERCTSTQFDPKVVAVFKKIIGDFKDK